jgi:hypothetical protein
MIGLDLSWVKCSLTNIGVHLGHHASQSFSFDGRLHEALDAVTHLSLIE